MVGLFREGQELEQFTTLQAVGSLLQNADKRLSTNVVPGAAG